MRLTFHDTTEYPKGLEGFSPLPPMPDDINEFQVWLYNIAHPSTSTWAERREQKEQEEYQRSITLCAKPISNLYDRVCLECGGHFTTKIEDKFFCCTECKRENYQKNNTAEAKYPRICACCGQNYMAKHSRQLYCSPKCAAEKNRDKARDRERKIRARRAVVDG